MTEPENRPDASSTLHLFADYFQFYLQDESASGDRSDDWGELLVSQMLAVGPGIVGIGTARNTRVPVSIYVLDGPPDDEIASWDHVAEASLEAPSGHIIIAGGSDYLPEATKLSIPAGIYRICSAARGLGSISSNGLRGEDQYHIFIWPEKEYRPPEILKKWIP